MPRRGEDFERAVYDFVRRLDPSAEVIFDHRVPDRDTGKLRQVDVWVNARTLGGHYPLSILISCKDQSRPLDVEAIDHFGAEIRSTAAHIGVIYSRSGFGKSAMKKADKLRISCCRLLENQPPDLPSQLWVEAYAAYPTHRILVATDDRGERPAVRWNELPRTADGSIFNTLALVCRDSVLSVVANDNPSHGCLRGDRLVEVGIPASSRYPAFAIHAALVWDWFEGLVDAFHLTGSLNMTDGHFSGETTVGPIPAEHTPSSSAWRRCGPPGPETPSLRTTVHVLASPTPQQLLQLMGDRQVFADGPWTFQSPPADAVGRSVVDMVRYQRGDGPMGLQVQFGRTPPA